MIERAVRLAFSTFPDAPTARRIAHEIVSAQLAACANVLPEIESIYRWKGDVERAAETLVLFKVSTEGYGAFEERLKSLHPYELPEIIALEITAGLPEYLRWVTEGCRPVRLSD
ncbi:MAG: divalent-cation tolerance protein CutA [Verrucomicrobiota bacterium]|nr:divalent-cation tolerance protein CutA [Verrucomicrobiota bacterium]